MWCGIPCSGIKAESEADALVDDNGLLWNECGEGRRNGGGGHRPMCRLREAARRRRTGRSRQLGGQCRHCPGDILFRPGQYVNDRPIWLHQAGLVGIGEKTNRLLRANQDKMAETGERRDSMVNWIRQELHWVAVTSSLDQAIKGRCEQSCVSRC